MFPISSDGVFEDPSIFFEYDKLLEDLLGDCNNPNGNEKAVKKRQREFEENKNSKKTAHRFNEKQRRQEMAALFASLRSLLPLQYIKGKRAMSDHMEQAANYIDDLKKNIEEMKIRKEKLKKLYIINESSSIAENDQDLRSCVEIKLSTEGLMEILISSSIINNESFPLSKVLADLLSRNLNVVSCVSTRASTTVCLHKIQIELNDPTRIDLSELQERLENMIMLA